MTGSPVFSINFTNQSMKNSQSILKCYRSYSQLFRPVTAIVRINEANSMAFLQREFLPSNDTYKTKTSAGNTLNFIRGNENVTHSAQGETVFLGGNFLSRISEYTQRERKCSFCKLQISISQTTDFYFANYRFSFRKLQIFISQTTDIHFENYRFPFRFVPFRFANYSKPHKVNFGSEFNDRLTRFFVKNSKLMFQFSFFLFACATLQFAVVVFFP